MHSVHLHQQSTDRRDDTTYNNPKPKEKYDDDMNYDGPTKANTAELSTVKILLQSVVSDDAD
jgi:hypothetical protein